MSVVEWISAFNAKECQNYLENIKVIQFALAIATLPTKWVLLISMVLFTVSDAKHQMKKIAIANANAQCERAFSIHG